MEWRFVHKTITSSVKQQFLIRQMHLASNQISARLFQSTITEEKLSEQSAQSVQGLMSLSKSYRNILEPPHVLNN